MPRFRVPTDAGTFEVETDVADPTDEELLALVEGQGPAAPAENEPGILRRAAAFTARVGAPVVGGLAGALAGPVGAAGGAAAGGAAGEALAEYILSEPFDPTEVALSAGLAAVPAGPFARAAARPGITLARRVALTAAEGATQGALAAEAESVAREGELAGIPQVAAGAVGGAVLGGGIGVVHGRLSRATPQAAALEGDLPPPAVTRPRTVVLGAAQPYIASDKATVYSHPILNSKGELVGNIQVRNEGERLKVDWLGYAEDAEGTRLTPNPKFGVEGLRDLREALREQYPDAQRVYGARVGKGDRIAEVPLGERATLTPEVPLAPQTAGAEAAQEAQGSLFRRVPGLAGDVPPKSPIPDDRLAELSDSVDRLFPHLGEVEKLSLKSTIAERGDEILAHSRSVQSHERTDALAQELVLDLSRPLPAGTALNAEQMRHVVNLVAPLQERVTQLAGDVASRPGDDALKLKLQHAATRLTNTVLSFSGARAEAGRTLNILRQQAKALAVGDAKSILAARRLGIDADQIAKVIAASPDDPVSQYRQIRDMYRPDWKDKLKWYYYTNILSGPQTHARNLVSNTVNLSLRPLSTVAGAAVDFAGAAATGREREVFAGEVPVMFQQMYRALPEAWNKALFMFRNGFSLSDVQDFEVRPAEMPGGIATNVVGRALAAADEFFRGIGFNMELHAGAFARARKQATAEGLSGAELRDRTAALTAELLDRKPADLMEQADTFSRRVTFQEQDNPVARGLQAFRDAVPGGAFLVPFVRTPANIFRQGLHFSPAGFLTAGAGKGRAGQQRMGEAALGTMLLAPVAWLAATGQITGAAPTDAGERDAFYASGKRPNSIRIGDTWVGYGELGPLALPFSVIANAADAWRKSGGEPSMETVGTIVGQVGRSTLDASYLNSLSAVFQAVEDPQRYGSAFLQNLAAGLIPAVGLQRNVARATDPFVRQPSTFVEGLEKNVPVLQERVLPRLDAFGQPVTRPTGAMALVVPTLSPAVVDPVRDELARVGVEPEPMKRARELRVGDEKVPLDPEADFAIRRATGAFRLLLVRDLLADPEYQGGTDEEKAAAARRALRQANTAADEAARALVRDGRPVTFEALTEGVDDAVVTEQRAPEPAAVPPAGGPRTSLDPIFERVGAQTGVDPTFLKAAAKVESNLNPDAVGEPTRYGTARGAMQVLPSTFRLYEAEARRLLGREPSIMEPVDNVLVGALLYRDLLDQTDNDPAAAATLYHGGPDPRQHGPKTRAYAAKVAATYAEFTGGA